MAASPCLSCKGSWGAPEKPSVINAAVSQSKIPRCLQSYMLCTAAPSSESLPSLARAGTLHRFVFILSYHPFLLLLLLLLLIFFFSKMERKKISPFPVPPCHVPKVPTNLRCPACTQPPLIAPAFSSGVSSAIATAAPPPSGNSHLHYHSLLQSRPQAPGSEQQLR